MPCLMEISPRSLRLTSNRAGRDEPRLDETETGRRGDRETRSKRSFGWLELVMMNQLDVKPDCIVVNKRRRRPV